MFLEFPPDQHLEALADLSPRERRLGILATAHNRATCSKILNLLRA